MRTGKKIFCIVIYLAHFQFSEHLFSKSILIQNNKIIGESKLGSKITGIYPYSNLKSIFIYDKDEMLR